MTAVLGAPPSARDRSLQFGCGSCGATLSVPRQLAGVSGACPLCGEWLDSPRAPGSERSSAGEFVALRRIIPDPALATDPVSPRTDSQRDWRVWRARRKQFKDWFQRRQAILSVSALLVAGAAVLFFASMSWKVPWQLPEDSFLARFIDDLTGGTGDGSGGEVPRHTRRP